MLEPASSPSSIPSSFTSSSSFQSPFPSSISPRGNDVLLLANNLTLNSFPPSSPSASESSSKKGRDHSPTSSEQETAVRPRFVCLTPGCGRRFKSQHTLKVHVDAHRPKTRIPFPCTLGCSETFSRQHDRLRHEVAKHKKVCDWLCNDCGRFFSSARTLGNHKCPRSPEGTRWVTETASGESTRL